MFEQREQMALHQSISQDGALWRIVTTGMGRLTLQQRCFAESFRSENEREIGRRMPSVWRLFKCHRREGNDYQTQVPRPLSAEKEKRREEQKIFVESLAKGISGNIQGQGATMAVMPRFSARNFEKGGVHRNGSQKSDLLREEFSKPLSFWGKGRISGFECGLPKNFPSAT